MANEKIKEKLAVVDYATLTIHFKTEESMNIINDMIKEILEGKHKDVWYELDILLSW